MGFLRNNRTNNHEQLKEILFFVTDLLNKHNIKYWLDYGTLLGAVRGKDIIPWDIDTDISCLEEDKEKIFALMPIINKKFYFCQHSFKNTGYQIRYGKGEKTHLDIFLWYKDEEMLRRRYYLGLNSYYGTDVRKGKDFPAEWVKELSEVTLADKIFTAPKDPEQMCLLRYGRSWKRPLHIYQWNITNPATNLTLIPDDKYKDYLNIKRNKTGGFVRLKSPKLKKKIKLFKQ